MSKPWQIGSSRPDQRAWLKLLLCLALGATAGCAKERTYDDVQRSEDDATVRSDAAPRDAQAGDAKADARGGGTQDGASADPARDASAEPDAARQCAVVPEPHELIVFDSARTPPLIRGQASPLTLELSGTVMGQVTAPVEGHRETFRELHIETGARQWRIAVLELASFGLRDGTEVTARLQLESPDASPIRALLTLHSGGQLAFVYALGDAVSRLNLPAELTATQGRPTCTVLSPCGPWSEHTLRVRDTGSGMSAELSSGEEKALGAFQVIHGGVSQRRPGTSSGCADGFVSRSQLIAYRSEPLGSPPGPCRPTHSSSLPGVRFEFPSDIQCHFSLAQAAAGIAIPYTLVVDSAVPGIAREHTGVSRCLRRDKLPADLYTLEELSGNQQRYALLDVGLCKNPVPDVPPITLAAGRYPHSFVWDGVNYSGESDTGRPKGPLFPAGIYTLRLHASGTRTSSSDISEPFEVESTLQIILTP